MQLLSLLALLAAAAAALPLQYDIPAELAALFGPASSSSSSSSASASSSASSCFYPAAFTLSQITTWTPAGTNASYLAFVFADNGTQITTPCAYNASSTSLTAGTGLAPRYACDNDVVSFIWQKGQVTAIETTCPGQTATKFEASGSVRLASLQCSPANCTSAAGLAVGLSQGQGAGTLCTAAGPLSANFTSQEPSPLQD